MQVLSDLGEKYPNIAYLYAALGNIALGINQILIKRVTVYIAPSQALFYRTIILAVVGFFLIQSQNKSVYIADKALFRTVLMRISFVGAAATAMYQSLKYLPVSTVTTIWNLGPIFIFFIQLHHYKSSFSMGNFMLTAVSFIGVIMMIQPEFIFGQSSVQKGQHYYVFIGIMLFSAIANAFNMHFVYLLAKKLDPAINIYYSYLGFLASSSLLSAHYPSRLRVEQLDLSFFMLIFAIAGTGFFVQNLILMANSLKKPSIMMPFGYLGVVTGLLADLYIFDTSFTFLTFSGVFLTSGGLLSGYLIHKEQKPAETTLKSQQQPKFQLKLRQTDDLPLTLNQSLNKLNTR